MRHPKGKGLSSKRPLKEAFPTNRSKKPAPKSKSLTVPNKREPLEEKMRDKVQAQINVFHFKQVAHRKLINRRREEIEVGPDRSNIFRCEFLKFKEEMNSLIGAQGTSHASSLFRAAVDEIEDYNEENQILGIHQQALEYGHDPEEIFKLIYSRIEQLQNYLIDPSSHPSIE